MRARVLMVANRLPIVASVHDGAIRIHPAPGGLATGLRGAHERSSGLWIGWPGDVAALTPAQREELWRRFESDRIVPVMLTRTEVRRYYAGFSNGVVWPLFHYLLDRVPLSTTDWPAYQAVNRKFADEVVRVHRDGDVIWVHDYQLMLVPGMIRERLPAARIGFFLHIPFPSFELFRILPWRREVVEGLLGSDLIGFHTAAYARYFITALRHILDTEMNGDDAAYRGRRVRIAAFPMGIDVARFEDIGAMASVQERAEAIRADAAGRKLLVGIDRLDYTKGIPRRLLAFERLLKQHPERRDGIRMIQVAVPSRTGVEPYRAFRRDVHELVGRINGTTSTVANVPLHYLDRSLDEEELLALYRAANVMLVTPLRDGMNLVAKEFVAARADEDGVLVLSELAGAADELGEALLVNPYDIDGVAGAMHRALEMSAAERTARMRALRRKVRSNTVHDWVLRFISELEGITESMERPLPAIDARAGDLVETLRRASPLVLLIDYDGTLVPIAEAPELARPDESLKALLRRVVRPGRQVHIVSGRARDVLDAWLGDLPLTLWAEHGLWRRNPGDAEWQAALRPDREWKASARPILDRAMDRTPGSLVEDKGDSIAWHYRLSDPVHGREQARRIRDRVDQLFPAREVETITGSKVIEVRPRGVNKGLAVEALVREHPDALFVAIGDDRTDEDMFAALPDTGIAIHVGTNDSKARHRLSGSAAVRHLLEEIADDEPQGVAVRQSG